jgi:hypothetical protein
MGKRSDFEKIDKDFYRTFDRRAVEPLIPLIKGCKYVEPCYGLGDLTRLLGSNAQCVNYSDITEGVDALSIDENYCKGADLIITNPPWSRDKKSDYILHKLIDHFRQLRPTWLLFDADWMHTKQSHELIQYCSKIVSVGRLIWIEGTNTTGKDNCCWYKFENNKCKTEFYGR